MTYIRRTILTLVLIAGITPAIAQVPPAVPALPDTERRTSYSISASTCACAVNFALYGDGTDFASWVEVFINGTRVNYNDSTYGWTITSPSGSLSSLPRPIANAVLTFTSAQTGTVQIVGARRPRRTSQFNENAGVPTRNFNQVLTDIISSARETWDKLNDVTGRMIVGRPGDTIGGTVPATADRASTVLGFDALGNVTTFAPGSGVTTSANVTFLQAGTGAVSRTVQGKLRGISVSPEDFGAADTAGASVDDAPFVQKAINAIQTAGGGSLYLRRCYYLNSAALSITNTSIEIYGPQSQTGCLIVAQTAGGIAFTSNTDPTTGTRGYWQLSLHDFAIVAKDNGTTPTNRGDCVRASWPMGPDQLPKMLVRNVTCKSETYLAQYTYFANGLHVTQADGFTADNFNWYQIGNTVGAGIWVDNSTTPSSYGYTVNNMNSNGGKYGIYTTGCLESLRVTNAILIVQQINLFADATTCSNTPLFGHTVELQVVGGSWNATQNNIRALYWNDITITGIEAGTLSSSPPNNFDSVYIANSGNINIASNQIAADQQGSGFATLRLVDSWSCTITGNAFANGDNGVKLSQTSNRGIAGCAIAGNTLTGQATASIDLGNSYANAVTSNNIFSFGTGIRSDNNAAANSLVSNNVIASAVTPYALQGGTTFIGTSIVPGPSQFFSGGFFTFASGANGYQWNNQSNGASLAKLGNGGNWIWNTYGAGVITSDSAGNIASSATLPNVNIGTPTGGVATSLTGTAAGLTAGNATKLATPRNIAVTGSTGLTAAGTAFDGSAAISLPLTGTLAVANGGTGAALTKLAWSATAPTISAGFCTSPSISSNNGTVAFAITIGSACAAGTGVLTMPAAGVGWACNFRNVTNNAANAPSQTASTTTSVSVTNYVRTTGVAGNWTAADVIVADCAAY